MCQYCNNQAAVIRHMVKHRCAEDLVGVIEQCSVYFTSTEPFSDDYANEGGTILFMCGDGGVYNIENDWVEVRLERVDTFDYCPKCGRKRSKDASTPKPWGYMLTSSDHETVFGICPSMNAVNNLIIKELDERMEHEGEFQLFPLLDEPQDLNVVVERKVTFK